MREFALRWLARLQPQSGKAVAGAYRSVLSPDVPSARLVLADLAELCHAAKTTFRPDDPSGLAFREGQRSVFLHIAQMVDLTPDEISQLEKEIRHGR